MTRTLEEWIEHKKKNANSIIEILEEQTIEVDGQVFNIVHNNDFKMRLLKDASFFLKEEIYYRHIQLIEKYCK